MTHGDRILCAVDPQVEVQRLDDRDLGDLVCELIERSWWNEVWERIYALALAEVTRRWMASLPLADPDRRG